jgi:hypothetical protein
VPIIRSTIDNEADCRDKLLLSVYSLTLVIYIYIGNEMFTPIGKMFTFVDEMFKSIGEMFKSIGEMTIPLKWTQICFTTLPLVHLSYLSQCQTP